MNTIMSYAQDNLANLDEIVAFLVKVYNSLPLQKLWRGASVPLVRPTNGI